MLAKFLLAWALMLPLRDVFCKNIPTFAGPFVSFAHRFSVCPSDGTIVIHVKNTRFNRANRFERQSLWGNASLKIPMDDNLSGYVRMASRSNNEWKENAFVINFPGGACSALREHCPAVYGIMEKLAPALKDRRAPCAVPPGEYVISNTSVHWTFPKFKMMPYGHYRFVVTIGKTARAPLMCLEVDAEVIPKLSYGNTFRRK